MPVLDGFYSSSNEVTLYPTGAGISSGVPNAFYVTGSGISYNVDVDVPAEPFLISAIPNPITFGQTLILTGVVFNEVVSVIVDGIGREFTYVDSTTITVELPLLSAGTKTVSLEYV